MPRRTGGTLFFDRPAAVMGYAAVGGKREAEGPLADGFDLLEKDTTFGQKTWEQAESRMQSLCAELVLRRCGIGAEGVDLLFGGDLENQCAASNYTMRALQIPFVGLYNACATMAEGLALSACFVSTGLARRAMALTSSHFCAAERQYRFPLEYGGKRTPTSQWTATAAGGVVLSGSGSGPYLRAVTFGKVMDFGIRDTSNMGAAMAPAAASTLLAYFRDSGRDPEEFDRIYTGDLGAVGSALAMQLCEREGLRLDKLHEDCGLLLYDRGRQQVGAGGSGAGCSAAVLCSHILPQFRTGALHRVLFVGTGALMSPTTALQKESIPGIAHLVAIEDA